MYIHKHVIDYLKYNIDSKPPESGGILGSSQGNIIDNIVLDINTNSPCCTYSPNVEFLNNCIEEWDKSKINFLGIFHTHFADVETLSKADKSYINKIMKAMPKNIKKLYFPIYTLPGRNLICYKAEIVHEQIVITKDTVFIV